MTLRQKLVLVGLGTFAILWALLLLYLCVLPILCHTESASVHSDGTRTITDREGWLEEIGWTEMDLDARIITVFIASWQFGIGMIPVWVAAIIGALVLWRTGRQEPRR